MPRENESVSMNLTLPWSLLLACRYVESAAEDYVVSDSLHRLLCSRTNPNHILF